jgi:A/G-specific adenine glycosylase
MLEEIAKQLLEWYRVHARQLPWRDISDPYAIWVSEIMLQQTRVETVIPYFDNWMATFPDVHTVATAELDEVLSAWEGLGYYRRVHNLRRAAQIIVKQHDGLLPESMDELEKLPGIGPYTAAAIAAFAFNKSVIALDGNLRRVLSRLFDYDQDPRTPSAREYLIQRAMQMMPDGEASNFNQSLMDLGALICIPSLPLCDRCPLNQDCLAFLHGTQQERPIREKKKPLPHYTVSAGVLRREGRVLIARRREGGLLGGLWEFPGGTCEEGEALEACLIREWREELDLQVDVGCALGVFSHAYTHFRVTLHAFECLLEEGEPKILVHDEIRWVRAKDLNEYPMGKIDREISKVLLANE